jgi:hypothetical protein
LKDYDEMRLTFGFIRGHKSALVNRRHVEGLDAEGRDRLANGVRVEVSRRRLDEVARELRGCAVASITFRSLVRACTSCLEALSWCAQAAPMTRSLTLWLALAGAASLNAQLITSAGIQNYPTQFTGDVFHHEPVPPGLLPLAGSGLTWDLTSLPSVPPMFTGSSFQRSATSATPYPALYPQATMCYWYGGQYPNYDYFRVGADSIVYQGSVWVDNGTSIPYSISEYPFCIPWNIALPAALGDAFHRIGEQYGHPTQYLCSWTIVGTGTFTYDGLVVSDAVLVLREDSSVGQINSTPCYEWVSASQPFVPFARYYPAIDHLSVHALTDLTAGVAEAGSVPQLQVAPNPSSDGHFRLSAPDARLLEVLSTDGRVVHVLTMRPEEPQAHVDLSAFAPGTYLVRAVNASGAPIGQTRLVITPR